MPLQRALRRVVGGAVVGLLSGGAWIMIACNSSDSEPDRWVELREAMVKRQVEGRGVKDPDVLAAIRSVPRHLFVPEDARDQAYDDSPQAIGLGQTISQPYIVH